LTMSDAAPLNSQLYCLTMSDAAPLNSQLYGVCVLGVGSSVLPTTSHAAFLKDKQSSCLPASTVMVS
jgi:hypothetical protein